MKYYVALILFILPIRFAHPLCELCDWQMTEGEIWVIAHKSLQQASKCGLPSPYKRVARSSDWIPMFLRDIDSYSKYREGFQLLVWWLNTDMREQIAYFEKRIAEEQAGIRDCERSILRADLCDNPEFWIADAHMAIDRHRAHIDQINLWIDRVRQNQALSEPYLQEGMAKIAKACSALYTECIEKHGDQSSYYERSVLHYDNGDVLSCLDDIQKFIATGEKIPSQDNVSELFYTQGVAYSDLGLYNKAVEALSEAIRLNPENKDAYLERAGAYFELGDLDKALLDFSSSGYRSTPVTKESSIEYASGFIAGALVGSAEAIADFVPSSLNSLRGLSNGIWTLVSSPAQFSREMVYACKLAAEYLSTHSTPDILLEMAPELKELVTNWDVLGGFDRARLMGHSIAKYGVEIFVPIGIFKGVKVFQELRKANMMLTLESFGYSTETRARLLQEVFARWDLRQRANLKIQIDKQGKHIRGHRNFQVGKSEFTHPDPQRLVDEYAGFGFKWRGDIPGAPGYQEVVNF